MPKFQPRGTRGYRNHGHVWRMIPGMCVTTWMINNQSFNCSCKTSHLSPNFAHLGPYTPKPAITITITVSQITPQQFAWPISVECRSSLAKCRREMAPATLGSRTRPVLVTNWPSSPLGYRRTWGMALILNVIDQLSACNDVMSIFCIWEPNRY